MLHFVAPLVPCGGLPIRKLSAAAEMAAQAHAIGFSRRRDVHLNDVNHFDLTNLTAWDVSTRSQQVTGLLLRNVN